MNNHPHDIHLLGNLYLNPYFFNEKNLTFALALSGYAFPDFSNEDTIRHFAVLHELDKIKSPSRRDEFLRGRYLCHHVLNRNASSQENLIIQKSDNEFPIWPTGFVGSLSHKKSIVGCLIGGSSRFQSMGLDIETLEKFHMGLMPKICNEEEYSYVTDIEALAIIFSAKETLFKAIYPLGKIFFYFHDARIVDFNTKEQQITFELKKDVAKNFATSQKVTVNLGRIFSQEKKLLGVYSFLLV